MRILGIETSCDETAAAVVEMGTNGTCTLLSNVVASSMDQHVQYGGVVPEIAARAQMESIMPVIEEALLQACHPEQSEGSTQILRSDQNDKKNTSGIYGIWDAGLGKNDGRRMINDKIHHRSPFPLPHSSDPWSQIDGIAVTYGAGLGGSLLVGVLTARSLAITHNKPLYAINHVEGHIYANFITDLGPNFVILNEVKDLESSAPPQNDKNEVRNQKELRNTKQETRNKKHEIRNIFETPNTKYHIPKFAPTFPMLGLIVSGGHTQLVLWRNHFDYTLLGQTQDDAIGEAFDKVAKILGLPYPGGPSVSKLAIKGDPHKYHLPTAKVNSISPGLVKLRSEISQNDERRIKNEDNLLCSAFSVQRSNNASYEQVGAASERGYDFSFSGPKTAVLRLAQQIAGKSYDFPSFELAGLLNESQKADIAASFQYSAIKTVVDKTIKAFEEFAPKSVVIGGGVASSPELRRQLNERLPLPIEYSDLKLCTDNGAMIAALGCFKAKLNQPATDPYKLDIAPNLSM